MSTTPPPRDYRKQLSNPRPAPHPARVQTEVDRRPAMIAAGVIMLLSALLNYGRQTFLRDVLPAETSSSQSYAAAALAGLLGLALLQGSEGARKVVIFLAAITAMAAAALTPLLARETAVAILLAFMFFEGVGLFSLLVGRAASRARVVIAVTLITVSWLGSLGAEVGLIRIPDERLRKNILEWSQASRALDEPGLGLQLPLPDGWHQLELDNPFLERGDAYALFAHQDGDALVTLIVQEDAVAFTSVDGYLDDLLATRRIDSPSLEEIERDDTMIGSLPARVSKIQWIAKGRRYGGNIIAWEDEWRYFAWTGVLRESRRVAGQAQLDALLDGLVARPVLATRVKQSIASITESCPYVSEELANALVRKLRQETVDPVVAFKMTNQWARRGVKRLTLEQVSHLRGLSDRLYGALPARDADRLGEYLERVRENDATERDEDERMSALMHRAALGMGDTALSEYRSLFSQAAFLATLR